jgi:hypothetical protein
MRLQTLCVLTIAVVCVAMAATAQAAYLPTNVVNIDFNGQQPDDSVGPTYSDAIVPGSGTTWNGITVASTPAGAYLDTVTGTNLLNSAGGATSIGITITPVGGDNGRAGTDPASLNALIGDYIFCWTGDDLVSSTITISGLGSATTADLAFYINGAGALDGISFTGAAHSTHAALIDLGDGAGYLLPFYSVPVFGGTITGVMTDASIYNQIAIVSGMSIATVPEPSTLVLLLSGVAGLLAYAWRKRK